MLRVATMSKRKTLLRNLPLAQLSQVQMLRFYQTQANIAENQHDPVENCPRTFNDE